MGWCSATDIMDTALEGAEAAVRSVLTGMGANTPRASWRQEQVDSALRPFVAKLAQQLRDSDWDCIEESNYFDRFQQEMLGHSDQEHLAYLVEKVKDAADDGGDLTTWTDKLVAHQRKMGHRA